MNEEINKLNVRELKRYLKENGKTNVSRLNKKELRKVANDIQKAKDLYDVERELCNHCNKLIDLCECERCLTCYENQMECECEKIVKPIIKKSIIETPIKENVVEPIIKKSIIEKEKVVKVVKKPTKKVKVIKKIIKKVKKEEITLLINLKSSKLKLKLFLLKYIIPEKKLHTDTFELINLILQKHKVIIPIEDQQNINNMFLKVYIEPNDKQQIILNDLIKYLVNCNNRI